MAEQILDQFDYLFTQQNFLWMVLMPLLWGIVKVFHTTVSALEGGLDTILTFNGFFENEGLNNIMNTVNPIAMALFAISIAYIGYMIMTGKNLNRQGVFTNVLLAIGFILGFSYLTSTLNDLSTDLVNAGKQAGVKGENQKLATQIVATNTTDLLYMERKAKWQENKDTFINNDITEKTFPYKDFTGVINASKEKEGVEEAGDYDYKLSSEEKKIFANKLVDKEDGSRELQEIKPADFPFIGQVSFLNQWYYRYHANFLPMFIQFGVVAFVLIFSMFKTMLLMLEIAFQKIIAPWVVATDLTTGQKMKQLFNNLVLNYASIGILMFVIKIYMLAMTYISTLGWNPWIVSIAMIALGKFVIDGPEEAKRLLGIDVGVKDGYQALMGSLAVAGAGLGLAKGTAGLAKGGAGKLAEWREKRDQVDDKGNKIRKPGMAERIGKAGSEGIYSMAGIAGEMSEVGTKGYAVNATKEGIQKSKEALSSKIESAMEAVKTPGSNVSEAFEEGKAKATSYAVASAEAMTGTTPESRNAINKVLNDNEGALTPSERTVLEKVVRGGEDLTPSERTILERLSGTSVLSDADRDAVRTVTEQLNTTGTASTEDKMAVHRILEEKSGDLAPQDRTAIERLMQEPGNLTTEDRTAIERVIEDKSNSLSAEDRTALERVLRQDLGSQPVSQDRTAMERIIHQDSGNTMTPQDRTAIERVLHQDSNNLGDKDRQVLERVMQQNGVATPQDRTAIERIIQDKGNNLSSQDRTAMERLITQPSTNIGNEDKTAIQRLISQPDSNVSSQDRTAIERVISNPTSATAQDKVAFERVMQQQSGNMNNSQKVAFERVNQTLGNQIHSTGNNINQSVNQTQGTTIGGNNSPLNRAVNETQGTSVGGNNSPLTRAVNETQGTSVGGNNSPLTRAVNETQGTSVGGNNSPLNRAVNETQGTSVGGNNSPLNRAVNETQGTSVGGNNSPLTRAVNETQGTSVGGNNSPLNRAVNETQGTSVGGNNSPLTRAVNETQGTKVNSDTNGLKRVDEVFGNKLNSTSENVTLRPTTSQQSKSIEFPEINLNKSKD
ncbi:pLS20_p028 family conjugation system transmembrane protein [Macrococcoides bohemicum]|uniref:DUF8208 domain-containing protein n=1 Tax=Macrococcoides bohemicum TaxID=1903056 RepID=A0A327ZZD4_9STAP|nr:hypothetical protein BHX94_12445 [Macrococcus bohemicus]